MILPEGRESDIRRLWGIEGYLGLAVFCRKYCYSQPEVEWVVQQMEKEATIMTKLKAGDRFEQRGLCFEIDRTIDEVAYGRYQAAPAMPSLWRHACWARTTGRNLEVGRPHIEMVTSTTLSAADLGPDWTYTIRKKTWAKGCYSEIIEVGQWGVLWA